MGTLTIMGDIRKRCIYVVLMKFIRKATEVVIVFLFVVMISAVFLQVVARYAFNSPPSWAEELARYCQVWIILLTSSICIRKGGLSERLRVKSIKRGRKRSGAWIS